MPIRALGVSLVAIAAVVATLTVARQRSEERATQPEPDSAGRVPAAPPLDLDAIRSAGM